MASAASPLPTNSGSPPMSALGGMMGSPNPPQGTSPESAAERAKDTVRQVMRQIQELKEGFKTISTQFPEFGPFSKTISQAADDGLTKIVGNALQTLEGPPPPTTAV